MGTHITWFDHLRSRITGHSASVYATRRAARADLLALEARRAQAAARLNEDIELIDRYVNPLERYMGGDRLLTPLGTILDRRSGKNLPLVWTELDLREFRRWSRVLCDINPFAVGFLGLLTDFHIRQGFGWQVVQRGTRNAEFETQNSDPFASSSLPNPNSPIHVCQAVLDEWRDQSRWPLVSREAFRRWRRDGEVFLRFFRGGADTYGLPVTRFVEPEQVGPPPGDDADGRWSFGILTDPEDVESIYAYFVRDPLGTGSEGDEVSAERILHLKANVDSSIKRGLPDFMPVQDDLERVRRMLRNMGEVAAIQTAIAWVSQYATATVDQVGTLIRAGSDYTRPKIGDPSGKLMDVVNYEPGTVIHMDSNRQFLTGPVGTGTAGFIQVEQAILRGCGSRWRFPEYFSGDASNNNMASSIVAGSPFVVAVEGNQLEWGVFERAVAKKVLELCVESGRLSPEQVANVDVKVTPPSVALANREEEERLRQMRHQAGVLSVTTWQQQVGLDTKHEAANFDAEAKRKAAKQGGGGGGQSSDSQPSGSSRSPMATEGRVQEGPPGPPPRQGLIWKDETHRWIRPETGEEFHHDGTPAKSSGTAQTKGKKIPTAKDPSKPVGGNPATSTGVKKPADNSSGGNGSGPDGSAGASSPSPSDHDEPNSVKIPDLEAFLRKSPDERMEALKSILPDNWDKFTVASADLERENDSKVAAMTAFLNNKSSKDLYALIRHYGTQEAPQKLKDWATTANEVLLNRMLQSLGAKLGQQAGWDAVVEGLGAVVNYKLITGKDAKDGFDGKDAGIVIAELAKSKNYGDHVFARMALVASLTQNKEPHGSNGIYLCPDYESAKFNPKRPEASAGQNPREGWPIPVITGAEFESGLADPTKLAATICERVKAKLNHEQVKEAMQKSEQVIAEQTAEATGELIARAQARSTEQGRAVLGKLIGSLDQAGQTAVVEHIAANNPEAAAAALAKANPDAILAKTAEILGITVEALKKMQKENTSGS